MTVEEILEGVWEKVRESASGFEDNPQTMLAMKTACFFGYSQAVSYPSGFSSDDINKAIGLMMLDDLKKILEGL